MLTFITFGSDHDFTHSAILGDVRASKGFVIVEAPNEDIARNIAHGIFGDKWSFIYTRDISQSHFSTSGQLYYPLGALLEIKWHVPLSRLEAEGVRR